MKKQKENGRPFPVRNGGSLNDGASYYPETCFKAGAGDYLIYNFKGGKVDFTENPAKASHYDSYNQAEEIRQELEKAYPSSHSLYNLPIRINYTVG
jgi:hypothetical protein